jgi:integrase
LGRNRKKAFQRLPKYVYAQRKRIIYRPPGSRHVVLGSADTPMADIWRAYEDLTGQSTDTLDYIVMEYKKGEAYKSLKSQKERGRLLKILTDTIATGRFGSKKYADISPGVIRKYLDYKGNVQANREIAALSAAWSWCYERDIVKLPNPCRGVKRLTEKPRQRLVTEAEYFTVYKIAPIYIQVAMELAYLCRMRVSEALDTRYKDMKDEGLDTRRLKGSKDAITLWSDRLRAACDRGLEGCMRVPGMPIVNDGKGSQIKTSTFHSAWQRLQVKAAKLGTERFTFHDLKRRGTSNFKGDKQAAGGWSDPRMVKIYDVSKPKVDATE